LPDPLSNLIDAPASPPCGLLIFSPCPESYLHTSSWRFPSFLLFLVPLTTVLTTHATLKTSVASLLRDKAAAQSRQDTRTASSSTRTALLLHDDLLWGLLVLHLALGRVVALLGRIALLLRWVELGLVAVAGRYVLAASHRCESATGAEGVRVLVWLGGDESLRLRWVLRLLIAVVALVRHGSRRNQV